MSLTKAFLGINLDLLENPKYQSLDTRASILYSLYADRSAASLHNAQLGNTAFCDDKGVFIRFSNELAAKIIRVSEKTISKFRKQLADLDLIEVVRDGLKGYKIYVKSVNPTPKDTKLLLPWKNHTVEIKKTVSYWTISAMINFAKNLTSSPVVNVVEKTTRTNKKIIPTSLSHASLSQDLNNNDLIDNAPARVQGQANEQTPYKTLPEKIRKSFNAAFGFINTNVALELHNLIAKSNMEMLYFAIKNAENRTITSPINYLKATILNALRRGEKCAQDMANFYNTNVKGMKKPRKFMTQQQVTKQAELAEQQFALKNPEKWAKIMQKRAQSKPVIPVFKLA